MEQAVKRRRSANVSPMLTTMAERLGGEREARHAVLKRYGAMWTYKQIAEWIAKEFGIEVSRWTVRKWCLRWESGGSIIIREPLKGGNP